MVTLKILFVPGDFRRVIAALMKVKVAVRTRAANISYQLGTDYIKLVYINLLNQKYSSGYAPYNPIYKKWKEQNSAQMKFWMLKGDLLQSLTVWRVRRDWQAGVPAGILDSGGKNYTGKRPPSYIAAYARVLEYGGNFKGQHHPARPLFRPTLEEYKGTGALRRLKEAKTIIQRSWR